MGSRTKTHVRRALIFTVGFTLMLGLILLLSHRRTLSDMEALYTESVGRSLERGYTRATAPPNWDIIPGEAAGPYRAAIDICDAGHVDLQARISTNLAIRAMAWESEDARARSYFAVPDPIAGSAECAKISGYDGVGDRVLVQLEPGTCELIVQCGPALDGIVDGSRRSDTTSPLGIWETWGFDERSDRTDQTHHWSNMGKLQILRGYARLRAGDHDGFLDDTFATLRMAQDLTRGAALEGCLCLPSVKLYTKILPFELARPALTADQARLLHGELDHLLRDAVDLATILEDDSITSMARRLKGRDVPFPAESVTWGELPPMPVKYRIANAIVLGHLVELWPIHVEMQREPLADRLARYERESERRASFPLGHWEPGGLTASARAFDLRITVLDAHFRLHRLAAADAVLLLETGQAPHAIDDLKRFDPDIDLIDPFTDTPFELIHRDGHRIVRSTALDDPEATGLALLRNYDPAEFLEVTLRREGPTGPTTTTPANPS
jgi:hypothetical protein